MKNTTLTVNGKNYRAKEVDTTALCVFEDCGLSITDIGSIDKKVFSFLRAYIAFCGNISVDKASEELNEHLINGGELDAITDTFAEALTESRFFRAIMENAEKKTPTTKKAK